MLHCKLGCGDTAGTTITDWRAHYIAVHLGVVEDTRTAEQWETAAEHLIREAARTGREFFVADVLKPLGPHPTPGRRQYVNGPIAQRIAGEGLITVADTGHSPKSTTKSSLVHKWVGTEKATGKRAAA